MLFMCKMFAVLLFLISDILLAYGFLKFTSSGDARSTERAREQLIVGFIFNLIAMFILVVSYAYQGIVFQNYSTLDWILAYASIGSFCVFVCSSLLYKINGMFLSKQMRKTFFQKADSILFILSFFSFIACVILFQLFAILVNF